MEVSLWTVVVAAVCDRATLWRAIREWVIRVWATLGWLRRG